MSDRWNFECVGGSLIHNIEHWDATKKDSEPYLIQVSWPLEWPRFENLHEFSQGANVIYVVDGNAMFLSATDIIRRNNGRNHVGTIVVGISYPIKEAVYSPRRSFDFCPPCENYTPPRDPQGNPQPQPYGGADIFLEFIKKTHEFLFDSIFSRISVRQTALFGHSYGALFTLHTLFTAPTSFDAYLTASPSIWWNEKFIFQEEQEFYQMPDHEHRPLVWLSCGSLEQSPRQKKGESGEDFARRLARSNERRMADNCEEMYQCLKASERIGYLEKRVYEGEDHGSVIASSLSGSILCFLENSLV